MENKTTWNLKAILATTKQKVIAITSAILLLALIVGIIIIAIGNQNPKVTSEMIYPSLELVGELTTAKLNFSGYKEYKDSGILFLNRSDFLITYEASLRAGIDMTKVEVDVNDLTKTVTITIPDAEIQEVKIKADSIKYYDEKFSLFNFDSKEDSDKAQKVAEDEAKIEAAETGILDYANEHAETLIRELLKDVVPEKYTIIIK